ncbi:hypothetical protein JOB18_038858 [Solea senegalensis]|uniref:Uncharacterized protein n=1 Tax=Solea senegalensis TaxID=28829 RepID=A0AAV6R995_SOLSE|nr:hypothetical protein JOB18_038858 [Solea senegalensis]
MNLCEAKGEKNPYRNTTAWNHSQAHAHERGSFEASKVFRSQQQGYFHTVQRQGLDTTGTANKMARGLNCQMRPGEVFRLNG